MTASSINNNCHTKRSSPSYKEYLPLLNRIEGQIIGIKNMITTERYCIDILTQLSAARGALKNLESKILDTHIQECVSEAFNNPEEQRKKIEEIRTIIKRFF